MIFFISVNVGHQLMYAMLVFLGFVTVMSVSVVSLQTVCARIYYIMYKTILNKALCEHLLKSILK